MFDIQNLMKQAQGLQEKIANAQSAFSNKIFIGSSGAGLVKVTLNGKFDVIEISIDDSLLNLSEKGTLQDLICTALNDVKSKIFEEMKKGSFIF